MASSKSILNFWGDGSIAKEQILAIRFHDEIAKTGGDGARYDVVYLKDLNDLTSHAIKTFSSLSDQALPAIESKPELPLQIVLNAQAGDRTSEAFVSSALLPLLDVLKLEYEVLRTSCEGDGVEIGRSISAKTKAADVRGVDILVLGGDGTTSEVLNGLAGDGTSSGGKAKYNLILLPRGTSNAYYASLFLPPASPFLSLVRYIQSRSPILPFSTKAPRPLLVLKTTIVAEDEKDVNVTFSHVVVSTSLHASILYDSESLRESIPSIERFKVAAQQNWGRFYNGSIKFAAKVSRWDGTRWENLTKLEERTIEGPFVYATSVLVDRLEPKFVIAPLRSGYSGREVDLVVLRPGQSRLIRGLLEGGKVEEARQKYGEILMTMFGKVYDNGAHVDLTFPGEEDVRVVEYFRTESWEWIPDTKNVEDVKDRLLCLDGTIKTISPGGKALIEVNQGDVAYVWA